MVVFFFFQAEDGIRDLYVTGVQTCALPIWPDRRQMLDQQGRGDAGGLPLRPRLRRRRRPGPKPRRRARSEERRVGKSVDLGGRRIIKKKKRKNKDRA